MSAPAIELGDGHGTSAVIAPDRGGTVVRYVRATAQGPIDVLHEPGCPLMFPIAGYSHSGPTIDRYAWEGVERAMPIHGFAMRRPWRVEEVTPTTARLALDPDDATRALYPFEFRLRLSCALVAGALCLDLEVMNAGDRPMPFSTGFHPYLRTPLAGPGRRDRCFVRLPACREVFARLHGIEIEPGLAPRTLAATAPAAPARSFTDLERLHARLVDESSGLAIGIDADLGSPFRCLTLWSPQAGSPFYCIEPRTALQDAFVHAAQGQLTVLAPGAAFAARLVMTLAEWPGDT